MSILSIQSSVAYGHVGNSAAVLPLQRLGFEVWPVDTATLSNHTDHARWRGGPAEPAKVGALVAGIAELGVLADCDGLLSGYLGAEALGAVVGDALERVRAANASAVYACDPVMGNAAKGFYVAGGVPEFIRARLVPAADIVTPNAFELGFLAGRPVEATDDAIEAADAVLAMGPRVVVCTSCPDEGAVATLAVSGDGAWRVRTSRIEAAANGAGDVLAALFLGHSLLGEDVATALSLAVSSVHAVLATTAETGSRDLALVAAQEALVAPPEIFAAERLR